MDPLTAKTPTYGVCQHYSMPSRALIARLPSRGQHTDICQTHALVMTMLGQGYQRPDGARELWASPHPERLLIQHPGTLDTRWLPPDHQLIGSAPVKTIWQAGAQIRWSTIVNPTTEVANFRPPPPGCETWTQWERTTGNRYRTPTKRTPIKNPDEITEWVRGKLPGLQTTSINLGARRTAHGQKRDRRVTIWTAHITGTGIVGDPEQWARVLAMGIGDGKAYGCGMVVCEEVAS